MRTRQAIRKVVMVTLDYDQDVLLIDGTPFPFVLADDPAWDEVDGGYLLYLVMPVDQLEIKGQS